MVTGDIESAGEPKPEPEPEPRKYPQSFQDRDRELGEILRQAREEAGRSISECAAKLSISRKRYGKLEKGYAPIYAAELEALVRFLGISPSQVFPQDMPGGKGKPAPVIISALPGESVQIVVNVARHNPEEETRPWPPRRYKKKRSQG
ncbi:MAG: helix-turn-helix transcriptional regulator [Chloroflexi bacterium]|nr:helix-turn-helix transcriptional regulator [Chloroflexota bacterium]